MDLITGIVNFFVSDATDLVGIVLPVLIERLNREVPDENERFLVTVLVCVVVAFVTNINNIAYGSPEQVLRSLIFIFGQSQLIFKIYFKNSWVRTKIRDYMKKTHPDTTASI